MNKFILGFLTALLLAAIIYGALVFLPGFFSGSKGPLYDSNIGKAEGAVLCDNQKHSCGYFGAAQNSGNLRVILTAAGNPVTGLEVDAADKPGATQYYMKLTDGSGVALFNGLPAGGYTIYFNGVNFPKEYGNAPTVPVVIEMGQTAERRIDLKSKQ